MKTELKENIKAIRMVEAATGSIILDKKTKFDRIIELGIKDSELFDIILAQIEIACYQNIYMQELLYGD